MIVSQITSPDEDGRLDILRIKTRRMQVRLFSQLEASS